MKLQHLFSVIPGLPADMGSSLEVSGVFSDARKMILGGVFVALRGSRFDGHDFIVDAIRAGAVALVVSDRSRVPGDFHGLVVSVDDTRPLLDRLAARFHGDPGREMFCVGVTGTNGKTSVTYLTEAVLNGAGLPTGVIGTVNHHLGERIWASDMTTPDPVFLQSRLRELRDAGAAALALEVSSHALDQRRADSVPFNAVIFTNLTRDHLDYHASMRAYFEAKQRLFLDLLWNTGKHPCYAIVNVDDEWGRRLKIADPAVLWTYGRDDADFRWVVKTRDFARTVFDVETPAGTVEVDLPMGGDHNVQNAVAALAAGMAAGFEPSTAAQALKSFTGVPGRLQSVANGAGLHVFVDYAHSPDALENVLRALTGVRAKMKAKSRLWTVFGCGGDRDKGKRPLMLKAALAGSDRVVVTSDNPRSEDPEAIIAEIMTGAAVGDRARIETITDRAEAIRHALEQAASGDVVLIAGKGHEDYQIIGAEKRSFSDVDVARDVLKGRTS